MTAFRRLARTGRTKSLATLAAFLCVCVAASTHAQTQSSLSIDIKVSKDNSSPSTAITTAAFSTSADKELLLAFISSDAANSTPNTSVTGVSGGGLIWELVKRTNAQLGTAEIWRAFSLTKLSNVKVAATLSESVDSSMTVVSFIGADPTGINGSGAIGAVGSGNAAGGAPTASVITTRNNSWVFGVGNDWDNAVSRTVGPNQSLIHQYLAPVNDTYWVQSQNAVTPQAGTTVTIKDTAPTGDRYNLSLVEVLPAQTPEPSGPLALDSQVSSDKSTASNTNTTPAFSTSAANELLLAFISADNKSSPNTTVTGITGGGLTWQLVKRTNVQLGTAEIWRALAANQLTNATITATLSQSVASSLTVLGFLGADPSGSNGSGAIGAVGTGNGSSGAPTASVTTTRNYSWVFGVGNDWQNAISRTLGNNQALVHQYLATVNDTYWVQGQRSTTPVSGTNVTINDTAPTGDRFNLSVVEVLPSTTSTPLQVTATAAPAPNAAGWNNTNVTVTFQCSGGVAPVQCPSPITLTTEGAHQQISGTATDGGGNTATASVQVSIDKTLPTISASVSPPPNPSGWNSTPVTITFICSDALSGVATCPAPQVVSSQGANQVVVGSTTDAAGNGASTSVTLNISTTSPTITATVTPTPNANGWNNTPVTVTFVCSAGGAPIASCPGPQTVSVDGANQKITGTTTDVAGATASTTVTINLETALPSIRASVSPSSNARGWNSSAVTVTFSCTQSVAPITQCPAPQTVTTEGAGQIVSGAVTDAAGNTDSTQVTVNISRTQPTITASVSPAPNGSGWVNTAPTVSFICNGPVAPIATCPAPQQLTRDGANLVVTGVVTDFAGATATASLVLKVDRTPPSLNVTSPLSGSNFTTGQVLVQGLVTDALSGVQSVTCGSVNATVAGGTFSCTVALLMGNNSVAVTATDLAGNSVTSNLSLVLAKPIAVQISSPTSLQLFPGNPVTVTGTVGDPTAVVTVGPVTAAINGGTFTATGLTLREGKNLLTASATTADGGVGSDTVAVYLDSTPATVRIDSPATGAVVTTSQVDVTGNVNDMVTGTVNGDQVSVVVNGVTAAVANRTFVARGVLLVPGNNTITATATDRAGNKTQHQVQVTLQQLAGQTLSVVSGNAQSSPINTLLPQSLVVLATDSLGRPMPNVALNFSVTKSDGLILAGQQKGRQLTIQTGANGQASVQFQVGSRNGAGTNQVAAGAPGFVGQVVFSEDTTVGTATQIHTVSGETQIGAVGTALPEPLVAIVFDAGGNPVPDVPVSFTVQSGGGMIGTGATFVQNTDSDGKASAVLVLGQQEGINNNAVTASFAGMTGQPASFVSSGVVPGPVANTSVSGIVLDDSDQPIANATASIRDTNLSARTNAQGQFTIASAPVGDIVLYIDGSTSTSPYSFPTLSFQMATIPGINNNLGHPVYLPVLDTSNSQVVGGDQPVQLTMTGVPGLVYTVAPNSVTFPDGSHVGRLTLSQVHGDRVPMAPPNGTGPRLVGTLQPAGVLFNPPIQVQLPNTDGLAPGQVEEIFSFHHDVEQFVVEGTARVSEDGSVVVSDPGFGLTVSGWHGGGGNTQNPTCGDSCGVCKACANGSCQVDSAQVGQSCNSDDDCVDNGKCDSGGKCNGDQKQITSVDLSATDADNPAATGSPLLKVAANDEDTYPVIFQATAKNSGGNLCSDIDYDWDYGDGVQETDAGDSPSHDYAVAGVYTVTVTAHCGDCQTAQFIQTMQVGIATVEEVDTVVHATPQPNASLGAQGYQDDPPYQAFQDPTQNVIGGQAAGSALVLPLGISPADMECVTTPDYSDPTFGAAVQALQKWQFPQDGSMNLSATSGPSTTVTFTHDGISQVSCFLDAAGTGQVAQSDSSVDVNTQIATIAVDDVDTEVHSNDLVQDMTQIPNGALLVTSGTFDLTDAGLGNNAFDLTLDLSVDSIDAAMVQKIDTVFVQNINTVNFTGSYAPGHAIKYVFAPAAAPFLICPGANTALVSTPVLDAGRNGVNGGATPSTTTTDFSPLNFNQRNGQDRRIRWVDAPALQLSQTQGCDQTNTLKSTSQGLRFSAYAVAFNVQLPHSYAVIGRAGWKLTWSGNVSEPGLVWTKDNTTGASSTGFQQNGYPTSGAAAGIEVNPPVGLSLIKTDGR